MNTKDEEYFLSTSSDLCYPDESNIINLILGTGQIFEQGTIKVGQNIVINIDYEHFRAKFQKIVDDWDEYDHCGNSSKKELVDALIESLKASNYKKE